jgi:flagellar protein FliO/FliZ
MAAGDYLRFLLALLFVLGLIALLAALLRRFPPAGLGARGNGQGRLAVVASVALDGRSRLLLIRRDDREHLLLQAPDGVRLVEAGIAVAPPPGGPPAAAPP